MFHFYMSCLHEETKTPFCPTCGSRIVVDDSKKLDNKILSTIGNGISVVWDNQNLPSEADRKRIWSNWSRTHETVRCILGVETLYKKGITHGWGGESINHPFAIFLWDESASYRQWMGEIIHRGVIEPVDITTDGKIRPIERLTNWLAEFREDLWFNRSDKWLGTFAEVCANLPGIDPTKIPAALTTRIGPVRVHYLPDWYDDIRTHIKQLKMAILYEAIKA